MRRLAWVVFALSALAVIGILFFYSDTPTDVAPTRPSAPASAAADAIPVPSGTVSVPRYQQAQPLETAPSPALPPPRTLVNGTMISKLSLIGNGRLTVQNGTGRDAVIKVVDEPARLSVVAFYVSAGQTASVEQLPDGDFRVLFASGTDWDSAAGTFTRDKTFAKFYSVLNFVTTESTRADGVYTQYSTFTLTLHKVVHGNAKTSKVQEADFLKY